MPRVYIIRRCSKLIAWLQAQYVTKTWIEISFKYILVSHDQEIMIFTLDTMWLSLGCVYGFVQFCLLTMESLVKQTEIFKGIKSTVQ